MYFILRHWLHTDFGTLLTYDDWLNDRPTHRLYPPIDAFCRRWLLSTTVEAMTVLATGASMVSLLFCPDVAFGGD